MSGPFLGQPLQGGNDQLPWAIRSLKAVDRWMAGLKAGTLETNVTGLVAKNVQDALAELLADLAVVNASFRERLTAARTYYVRTDGSDSNTGLANTAGGAFLTLQKAANVVFNTLDLGGFDVTIQVGAGTYTAGASVSSPQVGAGLVTFLGDNTTPSNVLINLTSASGFVATNPATKYAVKGFKIAVATSGYAVRATVGGTIYVSGNMEYGSATGCLHLAADYNGTIVIQANYSITGGAVAHLYALAAGVITLAGRTITGSGAQAFTYFALCQDQALIYAPTLTFSGTGSFTGTRYLVDGNSVIETNGGGANYFPGSIAGATATGGQYK